MFPGRQRVQEQVVAVPHGWRDCPDQIVAEELQEVVLGRERVAKDRGGRPVGGKVLQGPAVERGVEADDLVGEVGRLGPQPLDRRGPGGGGGEIRLRID
jgi:hypothetical protein